MAASAPPARADDDRVCAIAITGQKYPEDVVSEVIKRCKANDVLSFVVIAERKRYQSFPVNVLCRFDRQILFVPDSRNASCVYRGQPRSVDLAK